MTSNKRSNCMSDKHPKNVILTALYGVLQHSYESKSQLYINFFWYLVVLGPDTLFLTVFKSFSCYLKEWHPRDAWNSCFNGIWRCKMILHDVCLTQIFTGMCLSTKTQLSDHLLTRDAVFWSSFGWKNIKNVIFTGNYSILRAFLKKIPTEFFVSCREISV